MGREESGTESDGNGRYHIGVTAADGRSDVGDRAGRTGSKGASRESEVS